MLRDLLTRLRARLRNRTTERALDAELRFHIERQEADYRQAGLSAEEAARRVRLEFGSLDGVKDACRDAHRTRWLDDLTSDLRLAARLLWKDAGFTTATVATLALCIGANVAVFAVVRSVLLAPLPVPEPERLVLAVDAYPNAFPGGGEGRAGTSVAHYFDRLAEVDVFEEQALAQPRSFAVWEVAGLERRQGLAVTPSFFRVFGVSPALGRTFRDEEAEVGRDQAVVLSHAYWQQRFQGDPDIIGRDLRIDGRNHEVVGVMPASFSFLGDDVRFWTALALTEQEKQVRHGGGGSVMFARLKTGATFEQAHAQIEALNARTLERFPAYTDFAVSAGFHTLVVPLQDDMVRQVRGPLYFLWGAVVFVLLIGTANATSLRILRSSARTREFAMRAALGAGRGRLARQVLAESVALTLTGAVVGLLLGALFLEVLEVFVSGEVPLASEIGVNATVVWLTVGVTLVLGVVLALWPVATMPSARLRETIQYGGRSGTMGRTTRFVQRTLVVVQTSVAFVLVVGAVLLSMSFQRALAAAPGFVSENLLTANLDLPASRYEDAARRRVFVRDTLEGIRALPGVSSVGLTDGLPFGRCCGAVVVSPEGYVPTPGEAAVAPSRVVVDGEYFQAMGIPLVEGRFFDSRDRPGSMRAVIVDSVLARRFWPDQSALGKRMYYGVDITSTTSVFTVVGVVGEHAMRGVEDMLQPGGAYFVPLSQADLPVTRLAFAIRLSGDPAAIVNAVRAAVTAADADLPVFDVQMMEDRISRRLSPRRIPMLLAAAFALLALFLAAFGTHAVFACSVAQRSREFAIRLSLGSSPSRLFRLVALEAVGVLTVGLAIGIAGAVSLSHAITGVLYQTRPLEPVVTVTAVTVLVVVALSASFASASRAARVDAVAALLDI